MIYGIGTDIAEISRLAELYQRSGDRALEKILAPSERDDCKKSSDPARFLAKRFAAKEALGKAFGSGIREPLLLPAIAVDHDDQGKPFFVLGDAPAKAFRKLKLTAHLSLSDEREFAIAFVVLEQS